MTLIDCLIAALQVFPALMPVVVVLALMPMMAVPASTTMMAVVALMPVVMIPALTPVVIVIVGQGWHFEDRSTACSSRPPSPQQVPCRTSTGRCQPHQHEPSNCHVLSKNAFADKFGQALLCIDPTIKLVPTSNRSVVDLAAMSWRFHWVSKCVSEHEPSKARGGMVGIWPKKTFHA
jgi:hypothetical protein